MKYRVEFDSIGRIKVPGDKYWGASTERSNKYFNIGDFFRSPYQLFASLLPRRVYSYRLELF